MPLQTVRCLRYGRWKSTLFVFCVYLLIGGVFCPTLATAGGRIIKEDTDNDGQTDRIVHLAPSGDVVKLEADTNGNLKIDVFQYYKRGVVERIERDTDADGRIDERDLLANGKTTTRHSLDVNGEIIGILKFDGEQRPLEWRRDTTGDGRVNVWQRFRNEKPCEQTADLNGDGQIDQKIRLDEKGRSVESRHDLDEDGRLETTRHYKNGEICRQEGFTSGRKGPDVVTEFTGGQAVSEQRDTNGDGAFDVLVKMSKGKPISKEEDSNHDGRMDRFTTGDAERIPRWADCGQLGQRHAWRGDSENGRSCLFEPCI